MTRKASVVIEKDDHGFYAWCPELKGCQSQGASLEDVLANIREAIELYLETLPDDERTFEMQLECQRLLAGRVLLIGAGGAAASSCWRCRFTSSEDLGRSERGSRR